MIIIISEDEFVKGKYMYKKDYWNDENEPWDFPIEELDYLLDGQGWILPQYELSSCMKTCEPKISDSKKRTFYCGFSTGKLLTHLMLPSQMCHLRTREMSWVGSSSAISYGVSLILRVSLTIHRFMGWKEPLPFLER